MPHPRLSLVTLGAVVVLAACHRPAMRSAREGAPLPGCGLPMRLSASRGEPSADPSARVVVRASRVGNAQRIPGAVVTLRNATDSATAVTSGEGLVRLALPAGEYGLEVQQAGYQRLAVRTTLRAGWIDTLTARLETSCER